MIKEKDIIEIDLILKDNDTKEILDTTFKDIAKDNDLNIKKEYKPLKFIFGTGELLLAVEKNISDLNEGNTKTFVLKKEQAFGQRDPKKIELISLNEFKKENIKPELGLFVNIGNKSGKIISVSGGRVKVDFNPLFAGKDLEYTITLNKIINKDSEKIVALIDKILYFIPKNQLKYIINEKLKEVEIQLPLGLPKQIDYFKQVFSKMVLDSTSFDIVKYSQVFYRNKKGE
jgi:FKBP-type peptidyl-prolyl cis-trans isomerase 2